MANYKQIAESLWGLLDDISTAIDMYHPVVEGFETYVQKKVEERSKYLVSDGYKLYPLEELSQKEEQPDQPLLPLEIE